MSILYRNELIHCSFVAVCSVRMESVLVTTIAGSGDGMSEDGVGTTASVCRAEGIWYSDATGLLLVTETYSHRVRCVYPASEQRVCAVTRALTSVLVESGAMPVVPLISIMCDYVRSDSTSLRLLLQSIRHSFLLAVTIMC